MNKRQAKKQIKKRATRRYKVKKKIIKYNKQLVKDYPFLFLYNYAIGDYVYNHTYLDDLPVGWRKRFGLSICEELKQALIKLNVMEKYRIAQIKEKFGVLSWYGNCEEYQEVKDIIQKYEKLSKTTCQICGKPAKMTWQGGWAWTVCRDCWNKSQLGYDNPIPYEDVIVKEE